MKKLLVSILLLLLTNSLFSQAYNNEFDLNLRQINIEQQRSIFGLTEDEFKNLKGSPYVNKEFLLGKIYKGKEVAFDDIYLRYNAFSDEIEIRNSEVNGEIKYGALFKNSNELIKIYNQNYVFVPFENSNAKGNYFEILSEQKLFDLYKKISVKFHSPVYAKTTYDKNKPAEFKQTHTYYLVDKKGSFFELPSNKSKLLKFLSKENKKVKDFAKINKLNLDKEKDLIRLVSYYNTVQ